jgi:hypothetical protein
MKRLLLGISALVGVGLLTATTVRAHHAFAAEFDANRPIKVKGTLVKVDWVNPHSWFHIEVRRPDGQVEKWMFEGGGPAGLARRGITKDYEGLQPGAELLIEGYLSKGLPRRANARTMTFADGRAMFVGSSGTGAPADGADPTEGGQPQQR